MRKEAKIFKITDPDEVEEDEEDNVDASGNAEPAEQEFEVKEILYERIDKGELQYRVFWEGYDINDSTWEPAENLAKCHEVLQAYEDKKERERIWLEEHESAEKRKKRRRRKRQQREERERQREQEKSPSPDRRRDERSWRERSKSEEIFPELPKKKKGDKSRPQPKKEKREQVLAEFQEEHQAKKKKKKKLKQLKDQPSEPNKKRDRSAEENDSFPVVERKKRKRKIRVADSDDEGKVFYSKLIQEGTPQKKTRVEDSGESDSGESDSEDVEKPNDVSPPVSVSSRETSPVGGANLPPTEYVIPNKVFFAELFGDSSSSENGSPRNTASVAKKPLAPSDPPHLPQRNPTKLLPPPKNPVAVPAPPVQPPRSAPPRPPIVPPPTAPVAPPENSRLEAAIQRDRLRVEPTTKLIALNEVRPPPRTKAYIAPASSRMRPVPIEPVLPPSTLRRNNILGLPMNKRCIKSVTTPQRTPPSHTPSVPPEQGRPRPIPSIIRPVPPQNNPTFRIANQPRPPPSLNKSPRTPPYTSPHQLGLNRTPIPANRTPTTATAFFPTPPDSPRRQSGFKPSIKLHNTPDEDQNRKRIEEVPQDKVNRRLEESRKDNGGATKITQNKPNITVTNKTVGKPPRTDKTPSHIPQTREQIPVKPRRIVKPIQQSPSVLPTVPKDIQRLRPNLPAETVPASLVPSSAVPKSSWLPPVEPAVLPVGSAVESVPSDPRKKPPVHPHIQPSSGTAVAPLPASQVPPPPPPPQILASVNFNLPLLNQAFVNAVRPCNQRPLLPYSQASALFQPALTSPVLPNQSYGLPHQHSPLTNQHSFSLSFNQFYQPTQNFVNPHVMSNGPYLFTSNHFSFDGQIYPPRQQMVDNGGMMAPQPNSHLMQPVVNSFGVMQTSFHSVPPVAPSVHQENLHVLTDCSDIPLPVSPPKPPVCLKPAPPPPPPTPVKVVEVRKEMDEGEIADDNASDSDMDMSVSMDVEESMENKINGVELQRPDFEPISDPEDGELSDDETPALRIDLEPIPDAEDDPASNAVTTSAVQPTVPSLPTKETAELSDKDAAVATWLEDSSTEQNREIERKDSVREVSWVPFEYFSNRPLAKLKEIICAIEDDRFMVELEGSVTRTLVTLTDMQKYYFQELIAYLQRFPKEPAANDFAFRSSKYYVRQQGLL